MVNNRNHNLIIKIYSKDMNSISKIKKIKIDIIILSNKVVLIIA